MKDKVLRGIELLDREVPDWREKIDWDRLNMADCFRCILGQLFGEYAEGVDYLKITGAVHGFDVRPYQTREEHVKSFEILTDLWQQEAKPTG